MARLTSAQQGELRRYIKELKEIQNANVDTSDFGSIPRIVANVCSFPVEMGPDLKKELAAVIGELEAVASAAASGQDVMIPEKYTARTAYGSGIVSNVCRRTS